MDNSTFQVVESLFQEAVEFDERRQRLFLDEVAERHSREISDMLARLLSRDQSSTRWTDLGLSKSDPHLPPPAEPAGTILGHFKLIERLGYGGHGEVYLAQQLEPVQREVALKIIRADRDREDVIARFRAEEQALAMMSHPSIAAVYEAGLADRGRLYFAMEFVRGEPIDVYCDLRSLPIAERLRLFLKVCQGVQHAHQKGLIHRDLKPSNILVTERDGEAVPVLIDFGIAMATAATKKLDLMSDAPPQADEAAIGTPAYMSPEQAGDNPGDVDTRSDIYALGVVLCELLTGRTPLDVMIEASDSIADIRRKIREQQPPTPTSILRATDGVNAVATSRSVTTGRLRRMIAGDLDSIVARATKQQRADRYQTVDALARDVQNYLDHRPVRAAATSTAGRVRKFVRRNRLPLAAVFALVTLLSVGIVGTSIGMVRAERSAQQSHAMNSFLQELMTSSRTLEKGKDVPFIDVMQEGSKKAAVQFADHPRQEGEIRRILGHTFYTLAMFPEAESELRRSYELLRQSLGMDNEITLRSANLLGMTLLEKQELDEVEAIAREVAQHSEGKSGRMIERYFASQRLLADVAIKHGEYEQAEASLRELVPQVDAQLGRLHIEAYSFRMTLGQVLRNRAVKLDGEPRIAKFEESAVVFAEAIELQRERFGDEDALPLLASQIKLAAVRTEQHRYADAASIATPLVPRIEARFGRNHWLFTEAATAVAEAKYAQGDHAAAAEYILAVFDAALNMRPMRHPITLSRARDSMPILDAARRHDRGLPMATELHETLITYFGEDDPIVLEARAWIARFNDQAGLHDEAAAIYADLLPRRKALEGHPTAAYITLFYAGHLAARGEFEQAEAELNSLSDAGVVSINVGFPDDVALMYVEIYKAWGRPDKAAEYQALAESMWFE